MLSRKSQYLTAISINNITIYEVKRKAYIYTVYNIFK